MFKKPIYLVKLKYGQHITNNIKDIQKVSDSIPNKFNMMEKNIEKCDDLGNFMFEYYDVTNLKIPEKSEIDGIIKLVRED